MNIIQEYIDQIEFDEQYDNERETTITFYFMAPVEILDGRYPDAVSAEISVECMTDGNDAFLPYTGYCMISPAKEESDGSFLDYDWSEIELSNEDLDLLFGIYDSAVH